MTRPSLSKPSDGLATETRSVFGYVRVSTDRARGRRQEQRCPGTRRMPNGLADLPLELFYDHGISGWSGKTRPGFQQMMERVRNGEAAAVIIDTSSRLTRRGIRAAIEVLFTFDDAACELWTTEGGATARPVRDHEPRR